MKSNKYVWQEDDVQVNEMKSKPAKNESKEAFIKRIVNLDRFIGLPGEVKEQIAVNLWKHYKE
jgi:hypothetical protein